MMLPMCDDEDCSDEELKVWLVVAFHFGSMRCVMLSFNRWSGIQIYSNIGIGRKEKSHRQ
jgi:hypothetical protein